MITEESRAVLDFLLMLCSIGRHYPGFETDIHGAKRDEDGVYWVRVLKMTEPCGLTETSNGINKRRSYAGFKTGSPYCHHCDRLREE
jgi:hypothetical protein